MSWKKLNEHSDHIMEFVVNLDGYSVECTQCGCDVLVFKKGDPDLRVEHKLTNVPEDYFDEMVHSYKIREASDINNKGFIDQMEYLRDCGEDIDNLLEPFGTVEMKLDNQS